VDFFRLQRIIVQIRINQGFQHGVIDDRIAFVITRCQHRSSIGDVESDLQMRSSNVRVNELSSMRQRGVSLTKAYQKRRRVGHPGPKQRYSVCKQQRQKKNFRKYRPKGQTFLHRLILSLRLDMSEYCAAWRQKKSQRT
jgi:hypothetical protein